MSADAVASCESMVCCWLSTTAWAWATLACAAATAEFDPEPAPAPDPPLAGAGALAPDPVPAGGPTVETVCGAVDPDDPDVVALSRTAGVTVSAVVAALCVTCVVEAAVLDDVDAVDAADVELRQRLSGSDVLAELGDNRCHFPRFRETDGGAVHGGDGADRGHGLGNRPAGNASQPIRRSGRACHCHGDATTDGNGGNRRNADDDDPLAATATSGHSLTHPYCWMCRRIARGRSRLSCSPKTMPG